MKRREFILKAAAVPVALAAAPVAAVVGGVDWTTPAPVNIGKNRALKELILYGQSVRWIRPEYARLGKTPLRYEDVQISVADYYR